MNEWMSLQVEGPTARPAWVTKVLIKTSCAEILNPKDKQKTQNVSEEKKTLLRKFQQQTKDFSRI